MTWHDDPMDRTGARFRETDPVPPPPRDEMWASIEFARRFGSLAPRRLRAWPIGATGIGLAASLALGVAIGRSLAGPGPAQSEPGTAPVEPASAEPAAQPPALFRLVAEGHMAEAEVLLTGLNQTAPERPADVAVWARSLLMDTRLLLESPVASDPERARLLLDLELVLAQIATLPPADPAAELEIIRNGIRKTNVLARLRSASDALAAAGM